MLPPKRKRLKPGEKVLLSLPLAQVYLIVERTFLSEGLLATIHVARVFDDIVRVRCTLGELEALAGYVAAGARNTKDREVQKEFGAISEAIAKVQQAYFYDLSPSGTSRRLKLVRIDNA